MVSPRGVINCGNVSALVLAANPWRKFRAWEGDVPEEDASDGLHGDTLLMVEVAAVMIALVGVSIGRRRSKPKEKSGSAMSSQ
jgi:hypothetical protein